MDDPRRPAHPGRPGSAPPIRADDDDRTRAWTDPSLRGDGHDAVPTRVVPSRVARRGRPTRTGNGPVRTGGNGGPARTVPYGERIVPSRVARRTPVVAGREEPFGDRTLRFGLYTFVVVVGAFLFALALLPAFGAAGRAAQEFRDEFSALGKLSEITFPKPPVRSTVYAADGTKLATLYLNENRKYVKLDDISETARNAVIAIEDARFYEHQGLDVPGVIRALIANVTSGDIEQGASTLTQQLVRNIFPEKEVGRERTLARKIRETQVALRVERVYSKDQILELYLNDVYFGRGVYGLGTAAEYYFGKKATDLDINESATLAGLVAAPEKFNPQNDMEAAVNRRNVVIARMEELGYISEEEADAATAAPIALDIHKIKSKPADYKYPYFVEYVKQEILNDPAFGPTHELRVKRLFQGGLQIHTTLEPKLQKAGETAVDHYLPDKTDPTGALASVEAKSGKILAIVGGRNFKTSQVNPATGQGGLGRQAGSSFKIFTLTAAMEQGISVSRVFNGSSGQEVNCGPGYGTYVVNNADGGGGYMDMVSATTGSVNAYFVQLASQVGHSRVIEMAHRMGIKSPLPDVCSITLGTGEVNALEMASAISTLANEGVHCEPFAVDRAVDTRAENPAQRFVVNRKQGSCKRAVDQQVAEDVMGLLKNVVTSGTGTAANLGEWPAFGKTGSTNNLADANFAGCTRQICTHVWVGHLEGLIPMSNVHGVRVFGGTYPAQIWHDFMMVAMKGLPAIQLPDAPKPKSAVVPNVVGKKEATAIQILTKAHFTPITKTVASEEPAGIVARQSPGGGASAPAGGSVTIFVSNGKTPLGRVPNVVGMRVDAAKQAIRAAGFNPSVGYKNTTQHSQDGRVANQSPNGGQRVKQGSTVTITVYRYSGPTPSPSPT